MKREYLKEYSNGNQQAGELEEDQEKDIEEDIQTLGIKGWRKLSTERMEWRKITKKAKTHSGF
jgi:hypothetical protein